jgi:RND family efflux transporter MFP subunit
MNDVETSERLRDPVDRATGEPPKNNIPHAPSRWRGRLLGLGALSVLGVGLAAGAWRYEAQYRQVMATTAQHRDFVPNVRTATVQASDDIINVTLPATTSAFAAANINARATGYIEKRYADIGDHVKAGQLLAKIIAVELDHQIAQAEATLAQNGATVQQVQANLDLARVTWARDKPLVEKGWTTPQQGSIDVQNEKALEAGLAVAKANVAAQEAQLRVLNQQKAYQSVVAPFDGVITQRNVDAGTLVQADTVSGTFMFTIMRSDVIRTQVYVPQDQAFGLGPGVEAIVRVPEIPDRTFPGKVTRIADALQPGTRTLLTEIDVPNSDGALAPGIYCTVELHIPRKTPSLLVPAEAIIFNREGLQVAVVEDGVARIKKIVVARDLGTAVEVRGGVRPGDQVILNPAVDLVEGSKVLASSQAPRSTSQ